MFNVKDWALEQPGRVVWVGSLAVGLAGALGYGLAGAYMVDNQGLEAAGQPARWLWLPDPIGMTVGFVICAALAYGIGKVLQGSAALRTYRQTRERLERAGLTLPPPARLSLMKVEEADEACATLLEKSAAFIIGARKESEKYKEALSKYADPTLAGKLHLETGYKNLVTGKVRCAILFADIRGFTKMSEALKVEEVVSVLNDYFTLGAKAVDSHQGQINKFIGDAILAVFEDPPNHSTGFQATRNAVNAAMDLVQQFRARKAVWRDRISTPFDADLGVGVHFGEVILGSMGSPQRMEYTVIGDTVNFSSRLCSLAAAGQVKISQEAYTMVEGYFKADEMEPVKVKGKSGEYKTFLVTQKMPGA